MIKRFSSVFKKSENDWLKVTVSIFFSIIMVIFFGKTVAGSYALPTELPDTLTTGMGNVLTDRVTLFEDGLDGDEIISLVPYYAYDGNNKYTVYCLEKEKGWPSNDKAQTITKSEVPLDAGYVYILQNAYPNKSLTGNDKNDDYLTQVAIWFYQDRVNGVSDDTNGVLTAKQKNVIKSSSYYRYIEPLITGAVNAKNNPVTINPSFNISTSDFKLSGDNKYLVTDLITVDSNVSYDDYAVSVDNSAVEVLNSSNEVVGNNTISSGEPFKLRVNLSKIDNPISVNINVVVNYTDYVAYSYDPPSNMADTMQQAVVGTLVGVPKQKTVSASVSMPTGSLTIKKVDSSNNSPLAGASIEVIRKATNKTVASFESTTSDYVINNLLPGEYEIKELEAPNGYYIDEESSNVIISDSNLNISKTITNSKYDVKIRKVDSETGSVVSGAVLNIINSDNEVVDTITTTNDYVSVDTAKLKEGTYRVVEVSAPSGYVINTTEKKFSLDKTHTKITVDFEDKKNEVIIEKRDASDNSFVSGAVLRLIRVSDNKVIDEWTTNNKGHSVRGLEKGEYKVIEVKAPNGYTLSSSEVTVTITGEETEPITAVFYNSDNQIVINKVDEDGNPLSGAKLRITNSSGSEIDTFTTTKDPYTIDKLDPGTYYVEEIEAPSGYALNKERESFTIDENTTSVQVTMENAKSFIYIGKVDMSSGSYIAGAKLKLTSEDGSYSETFTSSNTPLKVAVPYGKYTLEETEAPSGYIKTDEKVSIDFNVNTTSNIYTISNKTGGLTIQKIDSETGNAVSGATLEIRNSSGDLVKTVTTTDTPTVVSDLSDGTYKIVETDTPDGYIKSDKEYEVTISSSNPNPSVTIENRPIIVNLGKIDARTGDYIAGATMRLSRLDGEMTPITFVSTASPYKVERLVPGIYSLEEIEAPSGYVGTGSKVTFRVLETGKVQTVNISNDITAISVNNRVLTVDTNGVSGYTYRLETRDGKVIDEFTTTEDVYTSDELEIGDYTLRQIEAPDGVIVNDSPIYFSVSDSNEVGVINFVNDFTKVEISKLDMANSEEVKGAHLVIRDSKGEVVEEWTSSDSPHYIEKLPVGKYTLTETIAPDGYVLNTSVIDFEVKSTGDIQSEVMYNSKPVEVPNTSRSATYIYLIGGILILIGGVLIYISYNNKIKKKSRKNI